MMEKFYSIKEVADIVGKSVRTVRGWIAKGRIPAFRVGGSWMFRQSALDRWIEVIAQEGESNPKQWKDGR